MPPAVAVRGDERDFAEVCALVGSVHRAPVASARPEVLRWLLLDNPQRRPEDTGPWVYRRDGAIVATITDAPYTIDINGHSRPAAWAINAAVAAPYQRTDVGESLWGSRRDFPTVLSGLGATRAGRSWALKWGWTDVGQVPGYACLARGRPGQGLARDAGSRASRIAARLGSAGVQTAVVDAFDERSDAVWRSVSGAYPVIARRDTQTLHWRFDQGPQRNLYTRCYVSQRGETIGHIVLRWRDWEGHPALRVVDHLARPEHLGKVLAAAAVRANQMEAAAVFCHTTRPSRRRMLALGFLPRIPPLHLMVYEAPGDPDGPVIARLDNWFVTGADSDSDLL